MPLNAAHGGVATVVVPEGVVCSSDETLGVSPVRRWAAALLLLLGLGLVGAVTHAAWATLRTSAIRLGAGSAVPLVVCQTRYGTPPPKRAAFPSETTLSISTPLAASLAAYTDGEGLMAVAAPRGWRCSAAIGADGSGQVRVVPPKPAREVVVGSETSACYGCTTGQACALFPAAARAYQAAYHSACPARRPPREAVYYLSKTLVAFEDPPYVKGEAALSGGPYPANAVMTYIPGNEDGSYLESCTLPEAAHSTCTAILNDFVDKYRNR